MAVFSPMSRQPFLIGDYQEGCEYVEPLFAALARVKTPMGTFGVMGNNDYERCHDEIIRTMKHYGMRPLEHEVDTLRKDGQQIILAGRYLSIRATAVLLNGTRTVTGRSSFVFLWIYSMASPMIFR